MQVVPLLNPFIKSDYYRYALQVEIQLLKPFTLLYGIGRLEALTELPFRLCKWKPSGDDM